MGKLDVGSANYLYGLDNGIGILLKALLELGCDGQHGCRTVTVTGVNSHGIHVFDEAYGNDLVFCVPYHLQFQLFPTQHRFLNEHLVDKADRKAAGGDRTQLFHVVDQPSTGSAHSVGRADHNRITEFLCHSFSVRDRVDGLALWHFNAQTVHGLFKGEPILTAFNSIYVDPDNLYTVFFQHPHAVEFRGKIQPGLSSQVRQQGVRSFTRDDFC